MLQIQQAQRYFHLVAFQRTKQFALSAIFGRHEFEVTNKTKLNADCLVQSFRLRSDTRFHRSETDYSVNQNENAPYEYEGVQFELNKIGLTVLGFPFKNLTVQIVSRLLSNYHLLSKGYFIKVDMAALLAANDLHTDHYRGTDHFFLSGVFLTVSGDSYLSTVKLEGDKPLDSDIYKVYFRDRMKDKQCRLEKCILKGSVGLNDTLKKTVVSAVHMDKFGNYKLYVHHDGKNLLSIPSVFEFLAELDCLTETPNNPIAHIWDDE